MISQKLLVETMLRTTDGAGPDRQSFYAADKFSLHLGYELKVQLDKGDAVHFSDECILILNT